VPFHGFGTLFDDLTQCRDRTRGHQRPSAAITGVTNSHLAHIPRSER
jgi:hypothetical protein